MAPPNNRRTGFSKRAQYTNFFAYLAGFAGVAVGGLLLAWSMSNPHALSGLRGMAADTAAPAGRAVAAGRAEGQDVLSTIGGFFMSGSRNADLQREVELARVQLAEAKALREENARLKALVGLVSDDGTPVVRARLIASTASGTRRFATISAGQSAGVAVGMPVRSPMGLVGRILEVSRSSARVLLITDVESLVPVRRARDGIAAFAQGEGDGRLRLRLVNLGINPLKPGDVFVTSGAGGLYRPNVAVAAVTKVTPDGALARILSDPTMSEFVAVEQSWANATAMPEALAEPPAGAGPARPGGR